MRGVIAAVLLLPLVAMADEDARLSDSRALAGALQAQLKTELLAAMSTGGPVQAIEVCRVRAPAIAARLSAESGATVGRTSLRHRNPQNAAKPWQRPVLQSFEQRLGAGEAAEDLVSFERTPDGGARYLQAIVTQPPCLACHGRTLAPDVQQAVHRAYPDDRATGFELGELRGAVVVEWPADAGSRR